MMCLLFDYFKLVSTPIRMLHANHFKYREYFERGKCDFLSTRFEFVGHDIMPTGNTPAVSKYDLITAWKLPITPAGLHSFLSLVNFYLKNQSCF